MKTIPPIVVSMLMLMLVGCVTIPDTFSAKFAVQQGTLRALDEDPEKAARALEILEKVRPAVAEETVTVGVIDQYVRDQISWENLSMADAQLLIVLLDRMKEELEVRIGSGVLNPDQRESMERVMDWIQEAAELVVKMRGTN